MFKVIGRRGLTDPFNSYAYSAAYFKRNLYIGTGRANLVFLRYGMPDIYIDHWPVPISSENYSPDFEEFISGAEIIKYDGLRKQWKLVHKSDITTNSDGLSFRRHYGYRSMCVVKEGIRDRELYVASTSRSKGNGPDLLKTQDGNIFELLPKIYPSDASFKELKLTSIRSLLQYEDLIITTITGAAGGRVNGSGLSIIFASDNPAKGGWHSINQDGFSTFPEVAVVYELCSFNGYLYAATGGLHGFQLWKGARLSKYDFRWSCVLKDGAGRGALNQGIISMCAFQDHLYLGTGIQNGGYDRKSGVGPAAGEVLRIDCKDNVEIVCGECRNGLKPISGYGPGFSNFFNAYIWKIQNVSDKYLLIGTMDWSVFGLFTNRTTRKSLFGKALELNTLNNLLDFRGGAELWKSNDGIYWNPVTINGFDNKYNFGVRNIIPAHRHVYIGTANPFGPEVYVRSTDDDPGVYVNNPRGGCEVIRLSKYI